MTMQPKKCQQCGADTFKEYYTTMQGSGRRPRTVEAWLCSDTCATTFFGEKIESVA